MKKKSEFKFSMVQVSKKILGMQLLPSLIIIRPPVALPLISFPLLSLFRFHPFALFFSQLVLETSRC